MATTISDIAEWIKANDYFALMAHIRSDGDSLGSTLGLMHALHDMGKHACVVYPEDIPAMYHFLPGADTLVDDESLPFPAKNVIVIDVAHPARLGRAANVFFDAEDCAVIDHHEVTNCIVERNVIRPGAAAAGELIFELVRALGVPLSKDIATCLYTAMSTDTGNFNFSNTTPTALRYTAECIEAGLNISDLARRLFRLKSPEKLRLFGIGVNNVRYYANNKLALTLVTRDMIRQAGAVRSDTEGIVNALMDVEGVYIAIFAEELADGTKFSFRSVGGVDVSVLAKQVGGGGHDRSSGATIPLPPEDAIRVVLNVFEPAAEQAGK